MSSDAVAITWYLRAATAESHRDSVAWPEPATWAQPPDYTSRLPSDRMGALLDQLQRHGGLELACAAGLSAGEQPQTALWLLLRACPTVGRLVERAVEGWPAFSASTRLESAIRGERLELTLSNGGREDAAGFPTLAAFALAALAGAIARHARGAPRPDHVVLPGVKDRGPLEQRLGTVVVRGDVARLVYPREVVERPIETRDALLERFLEASLRRSLRHLERAFSWQVDDLIRRRLPETIGMREAARSLNLSERTLRRRLEREGTSYRERLDRVRRSEALEMLPHRDVASVAQELGFVEPRSFQRAFRRWTGVSPKSYLRRLLDGEP